ncbi:uncharacterized protein LOC119828165 isoform X2 [Zerene cesonia]|uniref:uncharacterized protein LOC119828165 isoform X1 n=1 Tax=Zerene cesonia TaxID=33412 RepID=UPI0018E5A216|nr:uncharacterized protein LOC119828165 isoform X1 [Zerene cesonia]XP_038206188.1 uncharacterized protein LOC119828165 isoform X2 [Zerene cesonia]
MMKLVVLSCVLAAASATNLLAGYVAPWAYAAPLIQPYNYRGPLSLAPGQPANILGADGRPLDTLDVNLDRSAHLTAKALDNGIHLLKKRSVVAAPIAAAYAAPFAYSAPFAYAAPLIQPSNYRGPLSLAPGQPANILAADGRPLDTLDVNLDRAAHYTAKAFDGVHILKKRSAVLAPVAPVVSHVAVARAPLIASTYTYGAPIARISPISYAAHYAHVL